MPPLDVKLLDADGLFLGWVDETTARALVKQGDATVCERNGTARICCAPRRRPPDPRGDASWMLRKHWPTAFELVMYHERHQLLGDLKLCSTPRAWMLIFLRYFRDLTFPEVASAMGISEDAAFKLHSRTLSSLRSELSRRKIEFLRQVL